MQPEERDWAYLWDMREAAKDITAFLKGIRFDEFTRNKMIRYAVERQLMVIGKATNHISEEFQEKHPEISWGLIRVLPLNICAIRENLLCRVAASRSLAKKSPGLRGDCFGGRAPPRNDTQFGCGLEAALW